MSGVGVAQRVVRAFVVEWDAEDESPPREPESARPEANLDELVAAVKRAVPARAEPPEPAEEEMRRRDWMTGEPSS